jgi:hypothetical protein
MPYITLFASDKIRMHANGQTPDGLGIALEPFLTLPLDAADEALLEAVQACLRHSGRELPHQAWTAGDTAAYYAKLGVASRQALGRGLDVLPEDGRYTLTPIDAKGLFGEPDEVDEAELAGGIRRGLGLVGVRVS